MEQERVAQTVTEFAKKYNVRAGAVRIKGRADGGGQWSKDARHWSITLFTDAPRHAGEAIHQRSMTVEFSQGSAHTRTPTVEDVLDCLASDCQGIEESFEDWAGDYGYDPDSRKAEATYNQIRRQRVELMALLGRAAFHELVNDTERL